MIEKITTIPPSRDFERTNLRCVKRTAANAWPCRLYVDVLTYREYVVCAVEAKCVRANPRVERMLHTREL